MQPRGWRYAVGEHPDRVEAVERLDRKGAVYLHWRSLGEGAVRADVWRSLGFTVRDARQRLRPEAVAEAKARVKQKYNELLGLAAGLDAPKRALTIGQGLALAFDPSRGKWPVEKPYRKELRRALTQACGVWGRERTWASLKKSDVRELWRAVFAALRARGLQGHRATEIVVARVLTVAAWLREEDAIPPVSWIPWKHWHEELREDVEEISRAPIEVHRPRFTVDELRALLRTARDVDPRWNLILQLGAGLRLGQVARARRRMLDLDAAILDLRTTGKKHKLGAVRLLTAGQLGEVRAAMAPGGYLHEVEAAYLATGADYALFFGRSLARKSGGRQSTTAASKARRVPLTTSTLRDFFVANEWLAGIAHQPGRGWTGLRRITVDEGKHLKLSRDAMKELGGWADTQMADRIYADDDQTPAREEARDAFARIRGEAEDDAS